MAYFQKNLLSLLNIKGHMWKKIYSKHELTARKNRKKVVHLLFCSIVLFHYRGLHHLFVFCSFLQRYIPVWEAFSQPHRSILFLFLLASPALLSYFPSVMKAGVELRVFWGSGKGGRAAAVLDLLAFAAGSPCLWKWPTSVIVHLQGKQLLNWSFFLCLQKNGGLSSVL